MPIFSLDDVVGQCHHRVVHLLQVLFGLKCGVSASATVHTCKTHGFVEETVGGVFVFALGTMVDAVAELIGDDADVVVARALGRTHDLLSTVFVSRTACNGSLVSRRYCPASTPKCVVVWRGRRCDRQDGWTRVAVFWRQARGRESVVLIAPACLVCHRRSRRHVSDPLDRAGHFNREVAGSR
jgi:hypothetical protein